MYRTPAENLRRRNGFGLCRCCVWSRFECVTRFCHRVFFLHRCEIALTLQAAVSSLSRTAWCLLIQYHDHQTASRFFHLGMCPTLGSGVPRGCLTILPQIPTPSALIFAVFLELPRPVKPLVGNWSSRIIPGQTAPTAVQ